HVGPSVFFGPGRPSYARKDGSSKLLADSYDELRRVNFYGPAESSGTCDYRVLAATATLVFAISGTRPSCCMRPKASQLTQPSTILPFSKWAMVTREMVDCFPVG